MGAEPDTGQRVALYILRVWEACSSESQMHHGASFLLPENYKVVPVSVTQCVPFLVPHVFVLLSKVASNFSSLRTWLSDHCRPPFVYCHVLSPQNSVEWIMNLSCSSFHR